jgi:hypothetical protein
VRLQAGEGPINDRIAEADREKYRGSLHLDPMIGSRSRSATVRVAARAVER